MLLVSRHLPFQLDTIGNLHSLTIGLTNQGVTRLFFIGTQVEDHLKPGIGKLLSPSAFEPSRVQLLLAISIPSIPTTYQLKRSGNMRVEA